MSGECEYCGDHVLDCDCDERQEWYCPQDLQPDDGQLCRIKCVTIVDAYYLPDNKNGRWVQADDNKSQPAFITAWRPLYGDYYKNRPDCGDGK